MSYAPLHSEEHHKPIAGLTPEQVAQSRAEHGDNVLTAARRQGWWTQWIGKFDDPVIRILIIAAVLAIVAGIPENHYIEGVAIILAVLLATTLAFLNEYRAGKEFDILNKVNDDVPVKVIREGKYTSVPKRDVVVGDVVLIEVGEELPCDGQVMESVSLQVDESRLTGESVHVEKGPPKHGGAVEGEAHEAAYSADRLLRGTIVVDGHGLFVATAVGDGTEIGKTARAASEEPTEETPLNAQLSRLSKVIGVVGLGIAGLTYVALIVQAAMSRGEGPGVTGPVPPGSAGADAIAMYGGPVTAANPLSTMTGGQWFFAIVMMACGLLALAKVWLPIVVDGVELTGKKVRLPRWFHEKGIGAWTKCVLLGAGVFCVLAGSAVAMGVLSGSPSEWLAPGAGKEFLTFFMIAVTIIVVSVPEGLAMSVTLSLAYSMRRMTASNNLVRKMHACETIGAATVICSDKTGTLTMNEMRVFHMEFPGFDSNMGKADMTVPIVRLVCEAMSANSTANLASSGDETQKVMGNPTEGAMLLWLREHGVDYLAERKKFKTSQQWTFSTERKFMGTLGASRGGAGTGSMVLHTKGAPEIILGRCDRVLTEAGPVPMKDKRDEVIRRLKEFQLRGMRTLGLAYHDAPGEEDSLERLANGMVWLGFVAIQDPVRPEVPLAIEACRRAGIAVKMVTGDNPDTAREVARQIGLVSAHATNDGQLTGLEFGALDDERLLKKLPDMHVLSRARPLDKMRLVSLLQSQGHVVAVTGDGTNDAPALNHANVGLAMGKTGTAVAKEAADIILLDDSFQSIVNAVMWGRSLYLNIQRFIVFQLTINVAALGIAMMGPFIGVQLPLTVIQMLWINLIMDTFAALALATEPASWNTMNNPPRKSTDFIVTGEMARSIFGTGFVFIGVLVGYLLYAQEGGVSDKELTLCFNAFVMLQFWNLFNARRLGSSASALSGMGENKSFLFIAAAILLGQVMIVQFGGKVFKTVPLDVKEWALILGGTSVVLVWGEVRRLMKRIRERAG